MHSDVRAGTTRRGRENREAHTTLAVALVVAVSVWAAALVAAPWVLTHHDPGTAPVIAATIVYVTGNAVCHQLPSRSFSLWGTQVPVCARCSGLYAAAPVGLLLALVLGSGRVRARLAGPNRRLADSEHLWRLVLLVSAGPTLLTLGGELAGLIQPSGLMRAVSAAPLGFGTAWLVGLALRGDIH